MKTTVHWFERGCRFTAVYFPWLASDTPQMRAKLKKYFSSEYRDLLTFTGLAVEPLDILRFSYFGALLTVLLMVLFDVGIIFVTLFFLDGVDLISLLVIMLLSFISPLLVMNMLAQYPKTYARILKIRSLGDIPEVLSYLVMYLKLVPNLENSVKFAASESSTSLAYDLRKMLWDMEIRIYHGIDEALTSFATSWGQWSESFKRSLHLISSSVQERDEASRVLTLNRALDVALEGTREMMHQFASKLHQPTMVIYSIGIMIPLALVAMLPATGLIGLRITLLQVFLFYDIVLPLIVFLYVRRILLTRPATFTPPRIPQTHPDLVHIRKHVWCYVSLVLGFLVALPGILFLCSPILFPTDLPPGLLGFILDPQGIHSLVPMPLFLLWGVAVAFSVYTTMVYTPYKKIRDTIKQIEKEFSDALYIMGKRIAEMKSPEEGFLYTGRMMSGTKIAEVFYQTGYNLTALHTTIRDAMFSPEYGSLRYVFSDRVKAILRLFVEGIAKSQRAVSVSLVKIADHLKELQTVEQKIRDMLYELTSTMRATAALFAPLIAGVTLAITKLISTILGSLSGKLPAEDSFASSAFLFSTASESFTMENIRPEFFILVVGIYIVELAVLLTWFTNGIDEGDDKAAFMYSLGKVIPVSVAVLSITVIIGQHMFSSLVPPL